MYFMYFKIKPNVIKNCHYSFFACYLIWLKENINNIIWSQWGAHLSDHVLTSANWMMKCLRCPSENTDSTYSPGLPWLSRTRKSPCCFSSSWASVLGMAPWYHSCSPSGFSLVGITSKNWRGTKPRRSRQLRTEMRRCWWKKQQTLFWNLLMKSPVQTWASGWFQRWSVWGCQTLIPCLCFYPEI